MTRLGKCARGDRLCDIGQHCEITRVDDFSSEGLLQFSHKAAVRICDFDHQFDCRDSDLVKLDS